MISERFNSTGNCESLNDDVYQETCTEFEYGRFSAGNNAVIVFQPNDKVEYVSKVTLGKFQTSLR